MEQVGVQLLFLSHFLLALQYCLFIKKMAIQETLIMIYGLSAPLQTAILK